MRILSLVILLELLTGYSLAATNAQLSDFYEFVDKLCMDEDIECLEADPRRSQDADYIQYRVAGSLKKITLTPADYAVGQKVLRAHGLNLTSFREDYRDFDTMTIEELRKERENAKNMQVACGVSALACDIISAALTINPVLKIGGALVCSAAGTYCVLHVDSYVWEVERKLAAALDELDKQEKEAKERKEKEERERLEREKKVGGESTGPRVGTRGSELGGAPARDNRRRGHGGIRPNSERDTMMVNPF